MPLDRRGVPTVCLKAIAELFDKRTKLISVQPDASLPSAGFRGSENHFKFLLFVLVWVVLLVTLGVSDRVVLMPVVDVPVVAALRTYFIVVVHSCGER